MKRKYRGEHKLLIHWSYNGTDIRFSDSTLAESEAGDEIVQAFKSVSWYPMILKGKAVSRVEEELIFRLDV